MSDDFRDLFLDRTELRALAGLLREIPDLAEDLTISMTKQARTGVRVRTRGRSTHQALPYDPAAAEAAAALHATLVSWVRLVCEQRDLEYSGSTTTAGLARWLDRNLVALAMTDGVQAAPAGIRAVVERAQRIVCPSREPIVLDASTLERARAHRLNASGIAALAKELGDEYRTLTVRRVQTLRDAGRIAPLPGPWAPDWPEQFVVGRVLDEHRCHPTRRRRAEAS
ncbi:hypothetical protein [Nocardia sp. NPDC048505]|uniref:hypothetical protein n=1 Tax=unclassified Nocardia TaxID=2637762 RepID=UPI0033C38744